VTAQLVLLNQDPESGDTSAALTYLRLDITNGGSVAIDPTETSVRVARALAVSGAEPSADGQSVVLKFASPHGLAPQAITVESITAAAESASPSSITTSSAHGLVSGQEVLIAGVRGNTAMNGTWPATVTSSTAFTIPVAGNAVYQGGGTVTGPVGQAVPVVVQDVIGFGTALNVPWLATVLDAYTVGVPFVPPPGSSWIAGGAVVPFLYAPQNIGLFLFFTGLTGNGVSPVVVTFSAAHGLGPNGATAKLYVSDVQGNTAANGDWTATIVSATQVSLPTTGNGAYTSGSGEILAGTGIAPAYSAGAVQAGWSGTAGLLSDGVTLRLNLAPTVPFLAAALHFVRVLANDVGETVTPLVTLYAFTTIDTTPPAILAAVALDPKTVQVSFYKPVLQVSPTNADDALNPTNYTLVVSAGLPAVTPPVVSVVAGYAGNVVVLSLAYPMTPGTTYALTVSNVADTTAQANVSASPTNTATFTGWVSTVPGRVFSVWDLWPAMNQLEDVTGDLRNFLACFQEVANVLLGEIDSFLDILDPDVAPVAWLPSMLADQGNPFGSLLGTMAPDDMRRLVHALVPIYQLKGTDAGIVAALNFFLGITATITYTARGGLPLGSCWLSGPSGPGAGGGPAGGAMCLGTRRHIERMTFFVNIPSGLTETQTAQGQAIVAYMKRAGTRAIWLPA
jgi:phage tail-like protein